jgi:protein-tyrosine phosphatase
VVDIHSHVLWGMDDGSPTAEVSLEMLRQAAQAGTTDIVATPHSNGEFEYKPEVIAEQIQYLTEQTGGNPRLHRGCDFHLSFDNVVGALEEPRRYSINGKRYLLVEFSDLNISPSMDRILDQLLGVDLVPVVTHPERNPILRKDIKKLEEWVNQGCLIQVTALSVLGGFGKSASATAHQLLGKGLVHVIASDAHDPVHRHPRLDEAFNSVSEQYGEETADLLFTQNPGRIIRGDYVADGPLMGMTPKRKWWQFWGDSRE